MPTSKITIGISDNESPEAGANHTSLRSSITSDSKERRKQFGKNEHKQHGTEHNDSEE